MFYLHLISRRSKIFCNSSSHGAVIVELLWCLPAFVAGITLSAIVGMQLNARTALQDAVTNALTLAVTRANQAVGVHGTIPVIDNYVASFSNNNPFGGSDRTSRLRRFLVSREFEYLRQDEFLRRIRSVFSAPHTSNGADALQDAPIAAQIYAMAYVNQAMELNSLGEAKFPCDVLALEPGCLSCAFYPRPPPSTGLNPSLPGFTTVEIDPHYQEAMPAESQRTVQERRLTLACHYRPNFSLLSFLRITSVFGVDIQSLFDVRAVASVDSR